MMEALKVGLVAERTTLVDQGNTAKSLGSGDVEVFGTPAMIALMEAAAVAAIEPYLDPGQSSVGIELQVEHVAATPLGQTVRSSAELTGIEGRRLTFQVTAWDQVALIGKGSHTRVLIDRERFTANVKSKFSE
jgi:predicted thioesterase